jgi:hypothetical protein
MVRWFAGIDWGDTAHHIVIIDAAAQITATFRVAHTADGIHQLLTRLTQVLGDQDPATLACMVETSYGLLVTALVDRGFYVYPVNPKTVDRQRPASGLKTDQVDAYLLAKYGRSEFLDLRRLTPENPLIRELRLLTRDQDSLIQEQTRVVNHLTACLKSYFPVALTLFTHLQQRSTLAFLTAYPTLEHAQAATIPEIVATLKAAGSRRAVQFAPRIHRRLHAAQLLADAATIRAKSQLTVALVAQLGMLMTQIAHYDAVITRLFDSHGDHTIFQSLPGAKKRIAPRLLAEIGDDRQRYAHAGGLQAIAGTAPVLIQSGNSAKVRTRTACVKPLRNAMYQFAWLASMQDPWSAAYYQRKRREGKSHTMAVRALANTWLRIIFALWQQHARYDPAIFEAAQQQHAKRTIPSPAPARGVKAPSELAAPVILT